MNAPLRRTALGALVLLAAACGGRQDPISELGTEELWNAGVTAYNAEDWDDAIRYFDRYVLVGGSDPRVIQARYYVGQAYFEKRQYVTAAAELSRLAADLGRTDLADDARFMACRAYNELSPDPQLDQEYTRAALDHCGALLDYFPDSEYAEQAADIVRGMRGKLAEKSFEAGRWYHRRRAYDSALIYYEDVVANYPETTWAPKALLRQYEIYGVLEYDEEREEVRRRLVEDYPDSREASQVREGAASVG